ncbi:MAG: hypothetical protein V4717_20440 [Bacteroidota bacterium]
MTHYQKLRTAINNVLETRFEEEPGFLQSKLVPKLQILRDLLNFPAIKNVDFTNYLSLYQNDIQEDINRCICDSSENVIENTELLNSIKLHMPGKLKVVEFAFAFYKQDDALLLKEPKQRSIIPLNAINRKLLPT